MWQADGALLEARDAEMVLRALSSYASLGIDLTGLPLDANVLTMTVMATKMPFVGRG